MTTVRWYSHLNKSESQSTGKKVICLLDTVDINPKNIVVCQQLEHRFFAHFNTYLEYALYCKKKVAQSHRCFYEVIFGRNPQKPYFDIDIPIGVVSDDKHLTKTDAEELKRQVLVGILKEFDYLAEENILIFTSHSDEKYSYHIIVDNWCVTDHEENKIFCEKVMKHVEPRLSLFIDALVYKSIQQLRIFECHKFGSTRTKILDPKCKWKPSEKPISDAHKYALILGGSLVGNTSYCRITPSLKPPVPPRKKWDGKETILEEEDPSKCLDLMAKLAGLDSSRDMSFPYRVLSVKGSLILLKRLKPSHCRICDRVHENENPYLIVVGRRRKIYFNCRRVDPDQKLYIGELGETDYVDSLLTDEMVDTITPELDIGDAPSLEDLLQRVEIEAGDRQEEAISGGNISNALFDIKESIEKSKESKESGDGRESTDSGISPKGFTLEALSASADRHVHVGDAPETLIIKGAKADAPIPDFLLQGNLGFDVTKVPHNPTSITPTRIPDGSTQERREIMPMPYSVTATVIPKQEQASWDGDVKSRVLVISERLNDFKNGNKRSNKVVPKITPTILPSFSIYQ